MHPDCMQYLRLYYNLAWIKLEPCFHSAVVHEIGSAWAARTLFPSSSSFITFTMLLNRTLGTVPVINRCHRLTIKMVLRPSYSAKCAANSCPCAHQNVDMIQTNA